MLDKLVSSAFFVARTGCFRLMVSRPADAPRVVAEGREPLRVLVTGAGLAAGYGVARYSQTLAGTLVSRLAAASGRGIVLDVRAAPLLGAAAAVEHIGLAGAHSYHAAVFAPCHLEASFAGRSGIVRHAQAIQDHLLSTGSPTLQLAVLGVPLPAQRSALDLAAVQSGSRANRALEAAAASSSRAVFVPTAPYAGVRHPRPFDERYYADLGHAVADRLVPALELDVSVGRRRRAH